MTHEITIETAGRIDIPSIVSCNLGSKTVEKLKGFAPPREARHFCNENELNSQWKGLNMVNGGEVFKATVGGDIAGYILVRFNPEFLLIDNIDVHLKFQMRGIGSALVKYCEQEAARRKIYLSKLTITSNESGEIWKGFGFWVKMRYREIARYGTEFSKKFGFIEMERYLKNRHSYHK